MKKFTPLFILGIFLAGVVWMIFGMMNAMEVSKPKPKTTQSVSQ